MKRLMLCGFATFLVLAAPAVAADQPQDSQTATDQTDVVDSGSGIHWLIDWVRDLFPGDGDAIDSLVTPGGPTEHGDGESNG